MSSKGLTNQTMTLMHTDTVYFDIVKKGKYFVLAAYYEETQKIAISYTTTADNDIRAITAFLQGVFGFHGTPKHIVTDHEQVFSHPHFKLFIKYRNIEHSQTTPFPPDIKIKSQRILRSVIETKAKKRTEKEIFQPYKMLLKRMQRLFAADSLNYQEPISGIAHSLKHYILLALENIKARKLPAKQYFKESQGLLIKLSQFKELDNPMEIEEYLDTKITLLTEILSILSNIHLALENDPVLFVDKNGDGWGLKKGRFRRSCESFDKSTDKVFVYWKNKLKKVQVEQTCLMV